MGTEAVSGYRTLSLSTAALVVLVGAVALSLLLPTVAHSSSKQFMVVRDDRQLWQSGAPYRELALSEMQAVGVEAIQIFVNWNKVAPKPTSRRKPKFNESDSTTYGSAYFSQIDGLVRSATKRGFKIMISPIGPAPTWASTKKSSKLFSGQYPNLKRWSRFVRAIARRYNGRFNPGDGHGRVPRIRWWGSWNEPNYGAWLQPQWKYSSTLKKMVPYSPRLYRNLYKRTVTEVRRAKVRGAKFFVGELGPEPDGERRRRTAAENIGPKRWLYEFFCLDTKGRALKGKRRRAMGCPKKFAKIKADAISHHPHMTIEEQSPFARGRSATGLTIQDTGELVTILDRVARKNRVRKRLPIYFTEFGIRTAEGETGAAVTISKEAPPPDGGKGPPPDGEGKSPGDGGGPPGGDRGPSPPRGATRSEQAQYINEAEYVSYKYSRVRSHSQYSWVDDPSGAKAKGFQSGLFTSDYQAKSAYDAFRLPIFVSKRGCNKVAVWGKVRPKAGSMRVAIQAGDGTNFATVKTVTVKNSRRRYFKTSIKRSGACNEKWRLAWVDRNGTTYTSRVASVSNHR